MRLFYKRFRNNGDCNSRYEIGEFNINPEFFNSGLLNKVVGHDGKLAILTESTDPEKGVTVFYILGNEPHDFIKWAGAEDVEEIDLSWAFNDINQDNNTTICPRCGLKFTSIVSK